MAIPSKYREQLRTSCQGQLVVVPDHRDRVLKIYPMPVWDEIEEELMSRPNGDPVIRELQRKYIGRAAEVDMDGSGRILLPEVQREYANLEKKVTLLGQRDRFELWDEATWTAHNQQWMAEAQSESTAVSEALLNLRL